jgi:hypothetical protein
VKDYLRAVNRGQLHRAYGMLSERYRREVSEKDFVASARASGSDLKESQKAFLASSQPPRVRAHLTYGPGERLDLVVEDGQWKLDVDPLDFYSQRTPRDALRSFVRALERRRYDIVLRFVPERWRALMTEQKLKEKWEGDKRAELDVLLANLRRNLEARIEESGDRATMAYGDRFECRFVKENGLWKIEDPD